MAPRPPAVRISSPARVVHPGLGLTKLDVARYHAAVAELPAPPPP